MRTAMPFSTWLRITERWKSATSEESSRPRLIGPGVHHDGIRLGGIQVLELQAVKAEILAGRKGGFVLALELHAQHHDDVAIPNSLADIGGEAYAGRQLGQFHGQQRSRPAQHDPGAEFREQVHVRAGHAAVRDIADDGHPQAFQRGAPVQNGARIEQRLGGMFVGSIAGVDDGSGKMPRQEVRRAGSLVAHHDGVGPHGRQRVQGIHQRFALGNAGPRGGNGNRIRPQALGRDLETGARARGSLVKQVHDHLPAQRVQLLQRLALNGLEILGARQQRLDFVAPEFLDSEQSGVHVQATSEAAAFSTRSTFSVASISWNLTSMISASEVCTTRPMKRASMGSSRWPRSISTSSCTRAGRP